VTLSDLMSRCDVHHFVHLAFANNSFMLFVISINSDLHLFQNLKITFQDSHSGRIAVLIFEWIEFE